MKNVLPIGTIVKLKGIKKEMMIFGYYQTSKIGNKLVDYVGVPYPDGNIGPHVQLGFQEDDIETVLFRGFESPSFTLLSQELESVDTKALLAKLEKE